MKLGIISDTHGYLNNQIYTLFDGVDAIIHAGDIGDETVLIELRTIAPVTAVRGNMDRFGHPATYQEFVAKAFGGKRFFIVHDIGSPYAVKSHLFKSIQHYAPHVIIFGHTHIPYTSYIHDVLYFNPGSASRGRSGKKASVGLIQISNSHTTETICPLDI